MESVTYLCIAGGRETFFKFLSVSTTSDTPNESFPIESMAKIILLIGKKARAGL